MFVRKLAIVERDALVNHLDLFVRKLATQGILVPMLTMRQLTITDLMKKEGSNTDAQQKCTEWITCCGVKLYEKHKRILSSRSAWLDDELINAAQSMLKQQHPLIGGFQSPTLGNHLAMIPPDREFVQVVIVNNNHWVALSTVGCQPSSIKMFDSLGGRLPKRCLKLVADLMQSRERELTFEFVDVQEQKGASDCGLFALKFLTSIAMNKIQQHSSMTKKP